MMKKMGVLLGGGGGGERGKGEGRRKGYVAPPLSKLLGGGAGLAPMFLRLWKAVHSHIFPKKKMLLTVDNIEGFPRTNFSLPNSESLQTAISNLIKKKKKSGKFSKIVKNTVGKGKNCSLRAIARFPTVFSSDLYCRHVKPGLV